jgi:hypothetical protein
MRRILFYTKGLWGISTILIYTLWFISRLSPNGEVASVSSCIHPRPRPPTTTLSSLVFKVVVILSRPRGLLATVLMRLLQKSLAKLHQSITMSRPRRFTGTSKVAVVDPSRPLVPPRKPLASGMDVWPWFRRRPCRYPTIGAFGLSAGLSSITAVSQWYKGLSFYLCNM